MEKSFFLERKGEERRGKIMLEKLFHLRVLGLMGVVLHFTVGSVKTTDEMTKILKV